MVDHRPIIERFGGIRPMARKLGHASHTTVQGWWKSGQIPLNHWPTIAAKAEAEGIAFDMADLMPEAA
jgi:hypothetical protein